ncbi:MAG: hypothetical protein K940chlam3_01042 [Chlamydiae bacterium]|nr:hypothetical protein [Chlamydiota bacterium]
MRSVTFLASLILGISALLHADSDCLEEENDCCCHYDCHYVDIKESTKISALPACGPLMPPFLADPRKIGMSAGWRVHDQAIKHVGVNDGFGPDCPSDHSGPVSFGDYAGLIRFCNPFCRGGILDIGIEGNVWAIFQHTRESAPLINADYYVAIPITYAYRCWAFRVRLYHISSHLGDEFLCNNLGFDRRNPSSEYIDFFMSWVPNCDIRIFGGAGFIVRRDETFQHRRLYFEYGFDYYFPVARWFIPKSCVLGRPFLGAYIRNREDNDYKFDGTFVYGYEWSRLYCDYKKIRVFMEYHTGYSLEGQFSRLRTEYAAFVVYYGY